MSGDGVLLDSVVLIDHFNGIPAATRYLAEIGVRASISPITRAEVLSGFEPAAAAKARRLLDAYRLIPLDAAIADLAAELRRAKRWRLPDAFQAAVAVHHGLRLATRNVKDFPPKRFKFVVVPYAV